MELDECRGRWNWMSVMSTMNEQNGMRGVVWSRVARLGLSDASVDHLKCSIV
jgi:hypothetical protein